MQLILYMCNRCEGWICIRTQTTCEIYIFLCELLFHHNHNSVAIENEFLIFYAYVMDVIANLGCLYLIKK